MAEPTGLEPATSNVTGWRSNQLNYDSASRFGILDRRFRIEIKSYIFQIRDHKSQITNFQTGGHEGTRTPNFFLVREAVYQLTYMPVLSSALRRAVKANRQREPDAQTCVSKNSSCRLIFVREQDYYLLLVLDCQTCILS